MAVSAFPSSAPLDKTVVKAFGVKEGKTLEGLGLRTVGDLVRHYPRRYEHRGELTDLAGLIEGEHVTVVAEVETATVRRTRDGKALLLKWGERIVHVDVTTRAHRDVRNGPIHGFCTAGAAGVAYGTGTYRIIGYGLAGLLVGAGVVERDGDYPFALLALVFWVPATLWLLLGLARSRLAWQATGGLAISLFLLLWLSRVLQSSYLLWPLVFLILAGVLAAGERFVRSTSA